ncbi:MAG TPA: peptidoglycan DD-metalloendopeptidase family protein, partial [Allosphingosinicella sp.]|nr:peptidoglycan DD-metalloendopeptidase family protein [Allosphingosinicella sp.]
AQSTASEAAALALAKRQAAAAAQRSEQLERQAAALENQAARTRAEAAALAARIEAAEADITAAEARIRIIENLRAEQRARLGERQQPVVRLTAALQTMARRPPAMALVQPGSLDDVVHVRSMLASTLPAIRARTAGLRREIETGNRLRRHAEVAVAALVRSRENLRARRIALARFETEQRRRSASLGQSALFESDRALAFGEEARELAAMMSSRDYQARMRARLAELPGPILRPGSAGPSPAAAAPRNAPYRLPVEGRLVEGMGELSDGGIHARGLTFETAANAPVIVPRAGRIAYAGPFRGYGRIVIIEHGGGWTTLITNLGRIDARLGDTVGAGAPIGRTGPRESRVTVELRRGGRPVPIAPLIALG